MTALANKSELNRWYALAILGFVIVLIYFIFFQGFVSEHSLLNEELDSLEQDRQDHTQLVKIIPELQKRINTVKANVGDNTSFLLADSYNLGTPELTRILKSIVSENTSSSSECQTVSNTPYKDKNPDQFEKVVLKVRMRCQYDKMLNVLLAFQEHVPYLFVDNLNLEQRLVHTRRNQKATHPKLEVRFDLIAYLNKPVKIKKKNAKK
jgi:general secretion pathway protein M